MKQRTKESRKRLNSLILLVAFSAILLIASTYAWFAAQRDVTISNLEGKVEVSEGLEISLDGDKWSQEVDLSKETLTDAFTGANNIEPTELLPVSSQGTLKADGSKMLMYRGQATAADGKVALASIADVTEDASCGYFAFDVFLRNSTRGETADEIYLTKKSMVTALQTTGRFSSRAGKDNTGVQNTVRVALALYDKTAEVTDDATAVIAKTVGNSEKLEKVAIWEPNSNYHVDYVTKNYGSILIAPDAGLDNYVQSTGLQTQAQIATYAIKDGTTAVTNSYNWKDAGLAQQKVVQTTIPFADGTATAPSNYTMVETNPKLKLASDGSTIFTLPANKVARARVYVWIEGQDIDCINYASHGGGIEVNLGIEKPSKN